MQFKKSSTYIGVEKSNRFRLGWVKMKTIVPNVQEPVVDSLGARFYEAA